MWSAACGDTDSGSDDGLRVVATSTILGDLARNVVGADGTVEVLLPLGADPHDYQASAAQVASINDADLVLANGLGLEEGLADVLDAAAGDGARILEVADLLDPLPFAGGHDHDEEEEDHEEEGDEDPHVWMDPIRMADAARLLAAELDDVAPGGEWATRADRYAADLEAADEQIREILTTVPSERRKLVTNHDALGYFATRYEFEVIGVVIPGGATLAEPSSAELAELVEEVEHEGVPAIFAETTEPTALAEAVAAEVGDDVAVVELFTGSLGEPGSGAETLIEMLVTDAELIAEALS